MLIGTSSSGALAHQDHSDKANIYLEVSSRESAVCGDDVLSEQVAGDSDAPASHPAARSEPPHGSPCELVAEAPFANETAATAATAASDTALYPDPGISGRPTHAWVAQFFAQSRLHYIGSWQQR
jgi:hypothetical protein